MSASAARSNVMAKRLAIGVAGSTLNASMWRILDGTASVNMSMQIHLIILFTVGDQRSNIGQSFRATIRSDEVNARSD